MNAPLFTERIPYKPFEYPEYYTEGWLKQAQAFWLHTEIPMSGDVKDWKEKLNDKEKNLLETYYSASPKQNVQSPTIGRKKLYRGFLSMRYNKWQ